MASMNARKGPLGPGLPLPGEQKAILAFLQPDVELEQRDEAEDSRRLFNTPTRHEQRPEAHHDAIPSCSDLAPFAAHD